MNLKIGKSSLSSPGFKIQAFFHRFFLHCILWIVLIIPAISHATDTTTIINGNISVTGINIGDIISIGGGEVGVSALWGGISTKGSVGNVNDTETNINSVLIGNGTHLTGNITLNAINTGSIKNIGSTVNVNSIIVGK